jgi:DNA repair protein RadA/Sms
VAAVGEVGLGGEIRPVHQIQQRAREAARLGYTKLVVSDHAAKVPETGCRCLAVRTVNEALEVLEASSQPGRGSPGRRDGG